MADAGGGPVGGGGCFRGGGIAVSVGDGGTGNTWGSIGDDGETGWGCRGTPTCGPGTSDRDARRCGGGGTDGGGGCVAGGAFGSAAGAVAFGSAGCSAGGCVAGAFGFSSPSAGFSSPSAVSGGADGLGTDGPGTDGPGTGRSACSSIGPPANKASKDMGEHACRRAVMLIEMTGHESALDFHPPGVPLGGSKSNHPLTESGYNNGSSALNMACPMMISSIKPRSCNSTMMLHNFETSTSLSSLQKT